MAGLLPSLGGGRACPRACGEAFLCSLVICHPPCLLLWLQEGAKEFAALHNPRSKCSGRRRRRHHVVGASCSNTSASAVAETREGDSDRDTGNEWASSSSGTMPAQTPHSPLAVCAVRTCGSSQLGLSLACLCILHRDVEFGVSKQSRCCQLGLNKHEGHQALPLLLWDSLSSPRRRNVAQQSETFAGTCKARSPWL